MRWSLPEATEDVLPHAAARMETLRRTLLDRFIGYGYELVVPPMLEFIESLLTGSGKDLDLRTFRLLDQVSGRSMGIRADITPQVARIDAHVLNRQGVARLCYCAGVVHALPGKMYDTRDPIQIGAEIYGHDGLEADAEILRLLSCSLADAGLHASRIDVGHVGIFKALIDGFSVSDDVSEQLFSALQCKDEPQIRDLVIGLNPDLCNALLALPRLYGGPDVLNDAYRLLRFPDPLGSRIQQALAELRRLSDELGDLPLCFDLADLRGYHYHNGVAFAAYTSGSASAIARGGRYDSVGRVYGRSRAATGFSMDLRELARLSPNEASRRAILAPWPVSDAARQEIERLRALGERVVQELPGHEGHWREAGCDRRLTFCDGVWNVDDLREH